VVDKVALEQGFSEYFGFLANLHSTNFSTIIITITLGWYNRPVVTAVTKSSTVLIKKKLPWKRRTIGAVVFYAVHVI
jgi:hypothetical protein